MELVPLLYLPAVLLMWLVTVGWTFSIFRGGAPGLKERGLPIRRKHDASRPGRKPTQ
jgi:hypothetical protein